jgi:2-dehydropantoate 2-reductase
MRIAVFGTGGVGGLFRRAACSSRQDVMFVARGAHLNAIRTQGLRVESILGDFVVAPAQATNDLLGIGEVDVVLLGVKAWAGQGPRRSHLRMRRKRSWLARLRATRL